MRSPWHCVAPLAVLLASACHSSTTPGSPDASVTPGRDALLLADTVRSQDFATPADAPADVKPDAVDTAGAAPDTAKTDSTSGPLPDTATDPAGDPGTVNPDARADDPGTVAPPDGGRPDTGPSDGTVPLDNAAPTPDGPRDTGTAAPDLGASDLPSLGTKELIIQEDTLGFCAIDGKVYPRDGSTSITGYTGTGFADSDLGAGKGISWSVKSERAGLAKIVWRYAFGGAATNLRDGRLTVNGAVVADPVVFPYTGTSTDTSWNNWVESAPLAIPLVAGANYIRLEGIHEGGLANIDWVKLIGDGITADNPSFTLSVTPNDPDFGSVAVSPQQASYPFGTAITLTATAKSGYFLQSFSGEASSTSNPFVFNIERNTTIEAIFLPTGTAQAPGLVGYAAVQDDQGTPYLVTGGSLGPTVKATTIADLKAAAAGSDPRVVEITGSFDGSADAANVISVGSNKTLRGVGAAVFVGYEFNLAKVRNVIIQNLTISKVVADNSGQANDALVIGEKSRNVWIDHCDFYSDMEHDKDYYDGLIEIKNEASFITISWNTVHDHWKASLISSGDEQVADTVIRVTYHHNYFYNVNSRLPSIRFGKAHIFNNYYLNVGSAVNSRMGAIVRVEYNYFKGVSDTIVSQDSASNGTWQVNNNTFDGCSGPTTSTGALTPPYAYTPDPAANLPTAIPAGAGVGKI
jgi:pectate lyase